MANEAAQGGSGALSGVMSPASFEGGVLRPWLAHYPPGIEWDAEIPARPVWHLLDEAMARFPARPCIDFLGRRTTYGELGLLVDRAAKGLQGLGVGPGAKVGLFLPNCPYSVVFYFATLKAGATVVNFNPLYAEPEIAQQIEDSDTDVMVTLDLAALCNKITAQIGKTRLRHVVVCPMAAALPFAWLVQLCLVPFVLVF